MTDDYRSGRAIASRRRFLRNAALVTGAGLLSPFALACGGGGNNNTTAATRPTDVPGAGSPAARAGTGSPSAARQGSPAAQGGAPPTPHPIGTPAITAKGLGIGAFSGLTGQNLAAKPVSLAEQAYIKKLNADGGVFGRQITFTVEDDGNDPARTPALTQKLVEQDHVLAIMGAVNTRSMESVVEYLTAAAVPQLWILGADKEWGDFEKYPWTIGFQVSATDESRIYGRYIAKTLSDKKIGVLWENSQYGRNWLAFKQMLGKKNPVVSEQSYAEGEFDVSKQVSILKASGADILVLAANPFVAGTAMKIAAAQNWKPNIIMNSPCLNPQIFEAAGGAQNVEGAITAWWLQRADDNDPSLQPVKDTFAKYGSGLELSDQSIYGYAVGSMIAETLRRAGSNPTRQTLLDAAESFKNFRLPLLMPGISVSTSKTNHSPVRSAQLLRVTNGKFAYFGKPISGVP